MGVLFNNKDRLPIIGEPIQVDEIVIDTGLGEGRPTNLVEGTDNRRNEGTK